MLGAAFLNRFAANQDGSLVSPISSPVLWWVLVRAYPAFCRRGKHHLPCFQAGR